MSRSDVFSCWFIPEIYKDHRYQRHVTDFRKRGAFMARWTPTGVFQRPLSSSIAYTGQAASRRSYKRYRKEDIVRAVNMVMYEGVSQKRAAETCGVPFSTLYAHVNKRCRAVCGNAKQDPKSTDRKVF